LSIWHQFCKLVTKSFYQKVEVLGRVDLPDTGGVLFCANHINALLDPVIIQAATPLQLRPLARSGLFKFPMKVALNLIGAVPVYRPQDGRRKVGGNTHMFKKCHELLSNNECIIIFPEGQSHSDPHLHELKTGAARIALSSVELNGRCTVIPIGLTFTEKGQFRSSVLVHFGSPIDLELPAEIHAKDAIELINQRITKGLVSVTLNADSWEDIDLVTRLERFFSMRHGKYRGRSLSRSFASLQRLIEGQKLLSAHEPKRVRALISQLKGFERLCNILGIKDYHLTIRYRPLLIFGYLLRVCAIVCVGLPVALIGILNSYIPYILTKRIAPKFAKGVDQLDSAKVLTGFALLTIFWGFQSYLVYRWFGMSWMIGYFFVLIVSSSVAVAMRDEYSRILNNLRVFITFARKQQLKQYLIHKRHELEVELANLVRIANRLSAIAEDKN